MPNKYHVLQKVQGTWVPPLFLPLFFLLTDERGNSVEEEEEIVLYGCSLLYFLCPPGDASRGVFGISYVSVAEL